MNFNLVIKSRFIGAVEPLEGRVLGIVLAMELIKVSLAMREGELNDFLEIFLKIISLRDA